MTSLKQEIRKSGLKKLFIAKKAKISPMDLSHLIAGRRKTEGYQLKEKRVREILKLYSIN